MRKLLAGSIAVAIASLGWMAPANADLSATRQVIAIIGGDLYVGTAVGHLSGAGTLTLLSQSGPNVSCSGEFTSTKELGGAGQLQCDDGATAAFKFTRLGVFHGHGAGTHTRGPMSFTYGLSVAQSAQYLAVPAGKKLSTQGTVLALTDL